MKVKVYEDVNSRQIRLVMHNNMGLEQLPAQLLSALGELHLRTVLDSEELLFPAGVNVSCAIPELIQQGYHVCEPQAEDHLSSAA
ncbi:hypothetical protein [Leeia oryzae]|uniref:hypothetical protein n=1 Tax=Leeia oryzae TaxID=356662 RepID=UPI00036DFEB9|nr:hypothetical protein [Leeia oryzae]